MPADARTMVAGGHLEEDSAEQRGWMTNWPLHLLVLVTAVLVPVLSSQPWTPLVMGLWVAAYAAAHWAVVLRRLPGAGPMSVAVLIALSLLALVVTDQGLHLFASFMLMWVLLPSYRSGAIATLVLGTGLVLVLLPETLSTGPTGPALAVAIATGAGSTAFSLVIASWIWRSEVISAQRHALAEELADTVTTLERTRAELGALERRRGAHEESVRLSAEIHDTLAQSFTSITMLTQAARQPGVEPAPLLAQIEELSREGLAESRALISRSQQPLDLAASLDRLADDLAQRTAVDCSVDTSAWSPLSTRAEVVLLRTLQEALRNIEHHAEAATVRLRLAREDGQAVLEVEDDGIGFDPALPTAGFGLTGMRSRLEAEGGGLEIETARSRGTSLRAVLPGAPADAAVGSPAERLADSSTGSAVGSPAEPPAGSSTGSAAGSPAGSAADSAAGPAIVSPAPEVPRDR